jgi:hypothetical protein
MVRLREEDAREGREIEPPPERRANGRGSIWNAVQNEVGARMSTQPVPQDIPAPRASSTDNDLAAQFSKRVYRHWIEKVQEACRNPEFLGAFGLSSDGAQTLASEVVAAAGRLDVADQLATVVRPVINHWDGGANLGSPTPALLGARLINDFALYLGRGSMVTDSSLPARAQCFEQPSLHDEPLLGAQPAAPWSDYCRDWIISFVDMVEANVMSGSGPSFDPEQNAALGAILAELRSVKVERLM